MEAQNIAKQIRYRQWATDISDRLESKKTVIAWCKEHGISSKAYYYRLRRVREEIISGELVNKEMMCTQQATLPVESTVVFAEIPPPKKPVRGYPVIVMHLNNGTLEINNGAEQETIANVLKAMGSLC